MNWILDNLQLVIILASGFAWWLSQRKKPKDEEAGEQALPPVVDSTDELERTRRIQEEIRRKIAERSGGTRPVLPQPASTQVRRHEPPPVPVAPTTPEWSAGDAATLERQRRLEEQMRSLAARRPMKADEERAFRTAALEASRPPRGNRELLTALRNRATLQRAIVLREVLGPPVGLR
ncbi:MAG TPA: hypothetical protein VHF69_05600 [Candidatus Synoicihabitans sp.]|nr:hypothetical protein [Candidatus Synoicihabitans sp.]